jgi:hypothetical protein
LFGGSAMAQVRRYSQSQFFEKFLMATHPMTQAY